MIERESTEPSGRLQNQTSLDLDATLGIEESYAHLSLDDLLNELLERTRQLLHGDTAAILLLDTSSDTLIARTAKGLEGEVTQRVTVPVGKGFAGRIALQRKAIILADVDPDEVINPILLKSGIKTLIGVPLLVAGELLGVLHIGRLDDRKFSDADAEQLQLAADQIALVLRAHLYELERGATEGLQRHFVPSRYPEFPGFEIASRYIPSRSETSVGGDWYDVMKLSSSQVAFALGDVAGRGIAAAARMAQLRDSIRAYLLEGHGPAETLNLVADLVQMSSSGRMATVLIAVTNLDDSTLCLANAGHLPPLLVEDGTATFIEIEPSSPIGVHKRTRYTETEIVWPRKSTLLFYTDGLIELRDVSLSDRLEELRTVAAKSQFKNTEDLCHQLLSDFIPDGPKRDDVAMLLVKQSDLSLDSVEFNLTAVPTSLAQLRAIVSRWLKYRITDENLRFDIIFTSAEAAANAVEHAYGGEDATYHVELNSAPEKISVTIQDHGSWRDSRGTHRGRGIGLIERMSDGFTIDRADDGTTVKLQFGVPLETK